jgi:hypothetical protein
MAMPAPRMTARNSFDSKPTAFEDTVFFERLQSIVGTGRCKATARR